MTDITNDPAGFTPAHQLGYVMPIPVGDSLYYQFHRVCPKDMILIGKPMEKLTSFSSSGVDLAMETFWPAFDFLVRRQVDRIVQGGIPVSANLGRTRTLALLDQAAARTDIPTTSDFEECIEGFKALGCKRIAITAKWDPRLMGRVAEYLREAGLEPTEHMVADAHDAPQVMEVRPRDGIDMAIALGREAFRQNPQADALLLAGGAWLSLAAIPVIEREFGRPVITNPSATFWAAMRQFGRHSPEHGFGMLIESLQ